MAREVRRFGTPTGWIDDWYPVILDRKVLPYVPELVEHRNGEFCVSLDLSPSAVAEVCRHGYIPMGEFAQGRPILLIKSHRKRCVLDFGNLHISRKLKRHARGLTFRVNDNFAECLARVVSHYQPDTWLIEPLCNALIGLHRTPMKGVSFHSIEVYADNDLVAGEIGYTTGNIYTSLAGFHGRNGAGSVQLGILGLVLADSGFAFWDLGMDVPYKQTLGARLVKRDRFLRRWHGFCDRPTPSWSATRLETDEILARLKSYRDKAKTTDQI